MLHPPGKSNGMLGVGVSEAVDSVTIEASCSNGSLGWATQEDHLPTNGCGGSRSPQGEPSSPDKKVLASHEDSLEADCLFESMVDAAAADSSSVDSYVDVEGKRSIRQPLYAALEPC